MRRVYDDALYDTYRTKFVEVLYNIDPREVSEYDWGTYRAQTYKIKNIILERLEVEELGKDVNTSGIGNNWAHEPYVNVDGEEQIFGVLHITDDMYGGAYVYLTDIDGRRTTGSRHIRGTK